jgi:hypothetical protein
MRTLVNGLAVRCLVACCCCLGTQSLAAQEQSGPVAERVEFYDVPLMCPAARNLGCGSRAKPVLLALERDTAVDEAWLDREGRTLAVVWKTGTTPAVRASTVATVAKTHDVAVTAVDADARAKLTEGFRSGAGWHRGADVDRLSEEEAGVIADRLWTRLVARAPSASAKRDVVRASLTDAIRQCLIVDSPTCEETFRATLLATVRPHLDDTESGALAEAVKAGFLPLAGES